MNVLRYSCFLFLLMQIHAICFAWQADTVSHSNKLLKLNLLQLSVGIEYKFSERVSGYLQAGLPWFVTLGAETKTQMGFIAMVQPELRYYYNVWKRTEKKKRVEGFFANYFALHGQIPLARVDSNGINGFGFFPYYTGIHWGIQRRFFKNWYADINLGGGVTNYSGDFSIAPGALVAIGYAF